jgi:hypothetical protein
MKDLFEEAMPAGHESTAAKFSELLSSSIYAAGETMACEESA